MKIASFNVENLFDRPKVFNETQAVSDQVNDQVTRLNNLLELDRYSEQDKAQIKALLIALGLERSDESTFVLLRQNRGKLLSRPTNKPIEVVADGREDWIGWLELKTAPVNQIAIRNTAQVLRDVDADVMVVIEAENRIALKQYSEIVLKSVEGHPYEEIMIIDGNDPRGIDVGVMTKNGFTIGRMQSHVHDKDVAGRLIFSRDCPEYLIKTPSGESIWVLPNHFKSKFGGERCHFPSETVNPSQSSQRNLPAAYSRRRNQRHCFGRFKRYAHESGTEAIVGRNRPTRCFNAP
ncbi:MAG: hypothetical protein R2822_08560 [Spirosomataceae bacterium]